MKGLPLARMASALALGLAMGAQVAAATIEITPDTTPKWTSSLNKNMSAAEVSVLVGVADLVEVYKQNVSDASDTGSAASWYGTVFDNTPTDPQEATITWVGPGYISCPECFLLVKDGNQDPNQYVFDLWADVGSSIKWNGKDTLHLSGFWPNQGSISHVAIYAKEVLACTGPECTPERVPAPATLGLLGIGAIAAAVARRRGERSRK